MSKTMSPDEAEKLIEAVIGNDSNPTFATTPMQPGDIGLILRQQGGVEILSILPDNPGKLDLSSIGMRGMFAVALFKLAHDPALMADVLQRVSAEMQDATAANAVLHS